MKLEIGQKIHVDTDNEEWGRVASDATVIEISSKDVLANVESIKADILIPMVDIVPKRLGRVMPPKGYYVMKEDAYLPLHPREAIFTTGERGGGGHKYVSSQWDNASQDYDKKPLTDWVTLLWFCVPSRRELEDKYDYFEDFISIPSERGIPPMKR